LGPAKIANGLEGTGEMLKALLQLDKGRLEKNMILELVSWIMSFA
jgi:hypothetical protein